MMDDDETKRKAGLALLEIAYLRGHIPEDVYHDLNATKQWWEGLDDKKKNEIIADCRKAVENSAMYNHGKKSALLAPLLFIVVILIGAIPGAIIGAITGLFHFHIVAAVIWGLLFFIIYPRSRRTRGGQVDALTYFIALCGGIGGGLACYFIGNLVG